MALARAKRRDVGPDDSHALCAAPSRDWMLRFDDSFSDLEFGRNLDRALRAQPARDNGERYHSEKHGADNSFGGVSGPGSTGRAGKRLWLGWQPSWNTGRHRFRSIFDRESARTRPRHTGSCLLATD